MIEFLLFSLIGKAVFKLFVYLAPTMILYFIAKKIPKRRYDVKEVIKCKGMKPELYYKKQLEEMEAQPIKRQAIYEKEIIKNPFMVVDVGNVSQVRDLFKDKMKHKKLTRSQVLAIRNYLEEIVVDCKEKKFTNDSHAIYYCLKQLDSQQIDVTSLINFLK